MSHGEHTQVSKRSHFQNGPPRKSNYPLPHEAKEWQAAMEALILVATSGGPTMFARIGVMRALNRHVERVFNPDRKEHHWGRRKLVRER